MAVVDYFVFACAYLCILYAINLLPETFAGNNGVTGNDLAWNLYSHLRSIVHKL